MGASVAEYATLGDTQGRSSIFSLLTEIFDIGRSFDNWSVEFLRNVGAGVGVGKVNASGDIRVLLFDLCLSLT